MECWSKSAISAGSFLREPRGDFSALGLRTVPRNETDSTGMTGGNKPKVGIQSGTAVGLVIGQSGHSDAGTTRSRMCRLPAARPL